MVKLHPQSHAGNRGVLSHSSSAPQLTTLLGGATKRLCDAARAEPPHAPPADVIADRFRIVGTSSIGNGSGGEVWQAFDLETKSAVALKRLGARNLKERVRETSASADPLLAHHPLLVPPLAVVEDPRWAGSLFVCSAHQRCGDLRTFLHASEAFPLRNARAAIADLLIALDFLHATRGLCHRDVKPENMYYDGSTMRLGDFGLARPLPSSEEKEAREGEGRRRGGMTPQMVTLWYRAPEILLGSRDYGFSVDVFSAGALFAELLTGRPLFKGTNEIDQLALVFAVLGKPFTGQGSGWDPELAAAIDCFQVPTQSSSSAAAQKGGSGGGGGDSGGGGGRSSSSEYVSGGAPSWKGLAERLPFGTPAPALDLMSKLMAVNPCERPSARDALSHPFFWDEPKVATWRKQRSASATASAAALAAAVSSALEPRHVAAEEHDEENQSVEEGDDFGDLGDTDEEDQEEEDGAPSCSTSSSSSSLSSRTYALRLEPNRIVTSKSKLKKRRHRHVFGAASASVADSQAPSLHPSALKIPSALRPFVLTPKKRP